MMSNTGDRQTIDMGASMETEEALAIIDALNEVSDVLALSGSQVTFVGAAVAALGPQGRWPGIDVYSCSRGWFILFREAQGAHWAAAAADLPAALAAVPETDARARAQEQLAARGLV